MNKDIDTNKDYQSVDVLHTSTLGYQKDVVASVEHVLIRIGVLMITYSLGVYVPEAHPLVRRMAEYLAVAWLTCRIILHLSRWNNRHSFESSSVQHISRQHVVHSPTAQLMDDDENIESDDYDDDVVDEDHRGQTPASILASLHPAISQPHPALEQLFIIDTSNGRRFVPNSTEPFILDNSIFHGRMLTMVRTPDADNPDDSTLKGTAQHSELFVPYFAQRQRRFEFQWQPKLKQKVCLYFHNSSTYGSPSLSLHVLAIQ